MEVESSSGFYSDGVTIFAGNLMKYDQHHGIAFTLMTFLPIATDL